MPNINISVGQTQADYIYSLDIPNVSLLDAMIVSELRYSDPVLEIYLLPFCAVPQYNWDDDTYTGSFI